MNNEFMVRNDLTLENRFWNKVDKKGECECWNWKGYSGGLYGQIKTKRYGEEKKRLSITASKYSLFLKTNTWNDYRTYACHTCDNTKCVNPSHLFWGNGFENQFDAMKKHRRKSPFSSLEQAKSIKKNILNMRERGVFYKDIAIELGMTKTNVRRIALGERWANV